MKRTHLLPKIEEKNVYSTIYEAVEAIHSSGHTQCKDSCPLVSVRLVNDSPHFKVKG
jgi:hypothetical protein